MRHEIQSFPSSANRRISAVRTAWRWFSGAFADPNLSTVVVFCAIGLLAAINLILRFPDVSTVIMEYNLF
jgi:esterase/lipase superfamily enzyme